MNISRYADASTAPDTRKYALTPEYAAPERWRAERATIATDVNSFGIIAYELLTGSRPFGGAADELRERHLHQALLDERGQRGRQVGEVRGWGR